MFVVGCSGIDRGRETSPPRIKFWQALVMIKVRLIINIHTKSHSLDTTEREVMRKKYIASLESRSADQIAEEEALYVEIKRLEQNERRFSRERDELLRVLAGVESGLPSVAAASAADEEAYIQLFSDGKGLKKRKAIGGVDLDSPVSAGPGLNSAVLPGTPTRKAQSAKSAAYGKLLIPLW